MPNPYFKFKKFTVYHDKCAMKVGTDGVLIGAWTKINDATNILDVGTGTGIIALMLAQRSEGTISIDAIDIDKEAIIQAMDNIENSPFRQISCHHHSFQQYASTTKNKYDLIVSNPPYFSESLHSPHQKRTQARHTTSLKIEEFFSAASQMLSGNGRISLIFPHTEKTTLIRSAKDYGLYPSRLTNVYSTPSSKPIRALMEFSRFEKETEITDLIIEKERHIYSSEFAALVKDFYLKL